MKKSSLIFAFIPTIVWGLGYVVQSVGLQSVGPNTLNATRFLLAFLVLFPFVIIRRRNLYKDNQIPKIVRRKALIKGSLISGFFLFIGNSFQFWGMVYTTPGKASFITSLYIIIVPFIGIYFGEKIAKKIWVGVVLSLVGIYLLCFSNGIENINKGDLLVLICAFGFSMQIISISYFSPMCDSFSLSAFQLLVAAVLSFVSMFIFEDPNWIDIKAAWLPIVYCALLNSALGYTLQIMSQKFIPASIASLIFSMESVFALFFGWLILHETLSVKELIGCALVLLAIMISQKPPRRNKKVVTV
jgi:drug/metabolite transporter (DMT)-like permease